MGAGAILYYVLREEKKDSKSTGTRDIAKKANTAIKVSLDEITKEQVLEILQEILHSQENMKMYMKDITQELLTKNLSFEETYAKIKQVQPADPLEKYGLSMMEFDQLLDKHQTDPNVRDAIAKIMSPPNPGGNTSEKVQNITVKQIIDAHKYMLEELDKVVEHFQKSPKKDSFDAKTVTIVAQAMVGSRIENKFHI